MSNDGCARISEWMDDPLRMFLVVRRGAVSSIAEAGALAGAAAVACVREFAGDADLAAWRPRPGKVVLRARTAGQWAQVVEGEPCVVVGDAVAAIPPRRRSQRGPVLERLQAMTTALEPPPDASPTGGIAYLLNPRLEMSSGKTLAQIAHAAVMVAERDPGFDGRAPVVRPGQAEFDALCESGDLLARVVDGGLTEVALGTVTVLGWMQ
jgi:hypothetical protein